MSECNHDCGSCTANCDSREKKSFLEAQNAFSDIKNVIAVVSGKGGVGKSLVTSLLAVSMQRKGYKTAILDADVTGPSIPRCLGIKEKAQSDENGIYPVLSATGIKTMSVNLLLQEDTQPVVWRGPIIAGTVKQFWTDVLWGDVDYMFVDMPPGTGDVPLTVFQSLPVKGVIVVTSPQSLVSMIVEKAVRMAQMMEIPVFGIVENMSWFQCPDCGAKHSIFGEGKLKETAAQYGILNVARLPISEKLAKCTDSGMTELFEGDWLDGMTENIIKTFPA